MKNWSKSIPVLVVLFTGLLFTHRAAAQCGLNIVGHPFGCAPYSAQFERTDNSGKTVTSVQWTYTGGSASSTATFFTINLANPGTYKVSILVTYSNGDTCTSTAPAIVVFAPPVAVINLPTSPIYGPIQCFERNGQLNSFTFTQGSHPGSSGAPIVSYYWNFGDGDVGTGPNPTHSYQSSGTYNISLRVVDSNGCEGYDTIIGHIKVLENIVTKFTHNDNIGCNSDAIQFLNTTDTAGLELKAFYWNFGDGSPVDSTNYDPTKTYPPGIYLVSLTIENALGCTATDTQTIIVSKFQIKIFFKDTMCWSFAHNSGVVFNAEPQSSATTYSWNFGDPNSGQNNIAEYQWSASHKFVGGPPAGGAPAAGGLGGPGIYDVTFSMFSQTCGTLDTCFYVHVLGPMAAILLPNAFPPNDTIPPLHVPLSDFEAIDANRSSCGTQFIQYITFRNITNTPTAHWTYHFCHADTAVNSKGQKEISYSEMADCNGNRVIPYAYAITLIPTDSTVQYYTDSVADTTVWTKGQPIPTALINENKIYYPGMNSLVWNNMNDSNLVTCTLPNLVRFTNNSVKWRLHYAIDDNTYQNVLSPSQSFRDTCIWKNYPMATDSLTYYWQFYDPSGVKCTSTATNMDWDCNFSTLAAPYHYYRGTNGLPPSGCQTVQLSAYDPVTGCMDSIVMQLKQGPPQAGWNKQAYCKMTWEMQETQLAPQGSPGPAGPPLIGFMLSNQPNACAGYEYPFKINFAQTIPTCGAENWWVVFDSANVVKYKKCPDGDSVLDYGFTGDLGPGYSPALNGYPSGAPASFWETIPWNGNYWYNVGDSGCKTIGLVLQNGNCFDTAWYHDYICFNKLDAYFNIYNVVPPSSGNYAQPATGPALIPGDSGIGYTQVFLDSSENGQGHICQAPSANPYGTSPQDIQEGVRLYLFPHDTNQKDVTTFQYNITRNQYFQDPTYSNNNAKLGAWYYSNPPTGLFWPDSATLNPFTTASDSVAQVQQHVNYIDTPDIYIIIPPSAATVGLPPKRVLLNFPIYGTDTTGELDSLITNLHVNISVNDERARRIDAVCGSPYITVYVNKGFRVVGHTQILRLGGFKAVDSFITTPVGPGTGPQMTLPYPGFYTINSVSTNLEGCSQVSQYLLIYGHYAEFWVSDSVICLGQPVTLHWYVRYWSTQCPPLPGGGPPPPGCLNGYYDVDGNNFPNMIDFNPWDSANPTAYRDTLTGGTFKTNAPPGYRPETIAFNMGEPGDTTFHPFTPSKGPSYTPPPYTAPGVYTVMMKTTDWRGCSVYTVRKDLMKVIQVQAKFSLQTPSDTLTYCPPKQITYLDSSTIAGNKYTEKVAVNGQIKDSTFVVDSITDRVWKPGDGTDIVKTGYESQFIYDYVHADSLNVSLTVLTNNNCYDSLQRKHYVTIVGPTPRFTLIGNTAGCYPFTAHVHVTSHDVDAESWTWNFGDWPTKQSKSDLNSQTQAGQPGPDTLALLPYTADTGLFRITLTELDTFRDVTGASLPCTDTFPEPNSPVQFYVRVYPNSPIKISGDTLLCVNKTGSYTVNSTYNEYKTFNWSVNPSAHLANTTTTNGDSLNQILFTATDWQNAKNLGYVDSSGNALFTVTVHAESDTGGATTGCLRDTTFHVHVQFSVAGLTIDSSQANSATFTFHDSSQYVQRYVLLYGDGDSINTLKPGFAVTHTYTNLGGNNVPEGVPQPIIKFMVILKTFSSNGCPDSVIKSVSILREFDHYNVFTPNGDTANARFSMFIKGQISSSLKVYNRWGQLVFQSKGSNSDTAWSSDPANSWDGNDQGSGQPCPVGTYYYVWHFELVGGESKTINGAVTLIR